MKALLLLLLTTAGLWSCGSRPEAHGGAKASFVALGANADTLRFGEADLEGLYAMPGNRVRQAYFFKNHLFVYQEDAWRLAVIDREGNEVAGVALSPAFQGERLLITAVFYHDGEGVAFGSYFGKTYHFMPKGGTWQVTVTGTEDLGKPTAYRQWKYQKHTWGLYAIELEAPMPPELPATTCAALYKSGPQGGRGEEVLRVDYAQPIETIVTRPNDMALQVQAHHGQFTVLNKKSKEVLLWNAAMGRFQALTAVPPGAVFSTPVPFVTAQDSWVGNKLIWLADTSIPGTYYLVSMKKSRKQRVTHFYKYTVATGQWVLHATLTIKEIHEVLQIADGVAYMYRWEGSSCGISRLRLK